MRFANVGGRGALVVGEETFDIAGLSDSDLPADPMTLIVSHWDEVARLARRIPLGAGRPLAEADLSPGAAGGPHDRPCRG